MVTAFFEEIERLIQSRYFLKKILNLMPAPLKEVRTISPFAIIVLRVPGKSNVMAISWPTYRRCLVSIKTPLELILLMGA